MNQYEKKHEELKNQLRQLGINDDDEQNGQRESDAQYQSNNNQAIYLESSGTREKEVSDNR